jgi:hypothetical protein
MVMMSGADLLLVCSWLVIKYMPDMSDQQQANKPALSLEEELDVLEAVYRIGQKKGLDLLRPEQLKKLRDAGRMEIVKKMNGERRVMGLEEELLKRARGIVQESVSHLMSKYPEITNNNEWENLSDEEKSGVVNVIFSIHFGASIDGFLQDVLNYLSANQEEKI